MKKMTLEFKLPVSIIREDKQFIAYTSALDLSTSGQNLAEVKKRFNEIVNIFFEELVQKGTLEDVLYGLGWKCIQKIWNPPVVISHDLQTIKATV
jgi:hypothetical protein